MKSRIHHVWRGTLAVLCVSIGCLLAGNATAFAAVPVISEESVVSVSSSSATLQAQVNPEGSETIYRFEYGTSASYGTSIPVPDGAAGSGTSAVSVQTHLQSLAPATTYHYRVVAVSAGGTVAGGDETFRTQTVGTALTLPDGRQWEMVSPPVKEGGRILPIEEHEGVQAAVGGDAFTYEAAAPTEPNPQGSDETSAIFSVRGADGGWSSRDIATPHEAATGVSGGGNEYRFFSPDLSLSVVEPLGDSEPPLSARATERTMYLRDNQPLQPEAGERALYSEAESEAPLGAGGVGYLPLVTAADVQSGVKFGAKFPEGVRFVGASPDLSHVVFTSRAALTSAPIEGALYEWSAGHIELVSVLPEGEAVRGALGAGGFYAGNTRNAVSGDGSRLFWTSAAGHLYMRDTAKGEAVELDVPQGISATGETGAHFQTASSDGSKAFFTDSQALTAAAKGTDLYECEMIEAAGKDACRLSDLTAPENAGEAAEVKGLVSGSSDGSYVYLVATGMLAPGAIGEADNLYVLHDSGGEWTTKLIATLAADDAPDWSVNLTGMPVRVSPNGRYLAFMSDARLTGYDNLDAKSSMPDEELYLYDAASGHLVCASCNPTGARPDGVKFNAEELLINNNSVAWGGGWLAADVPGWNPMRLLTARNQSRYLSNDGRLFFDAVDGLVPQATNGRFDVYEYEPLGVGSCTSSSTTFSDLSSGCVALISAGSSGEESVFLDASENGEDVFFLTTARLAPQDLDTAFDVYDAHVCSTSAPCPAVTVVPPACTTADSCRAAPLPQPGVFGAPASATFNGAGNPVPAVVKPTIAVSKPKQAKGKQKRKRKRKTKAKRRGKKQRGASARGRRSVQVSGKSSSPSSRTGR